MPIRAISWPVIGVESGGNRKYTQKRGEQESLHVDKIAPMSRLFKGNANTVIAGIVGLR